MFPQIARIVFIALSSAGASAEQYSSSYVREFAAETFAEMRTDDEAYGLGRAAWFGDLCSHRYKILPSLAYFLDVQFADIEAFESGVPANLLTRYYDGFYDTVDAYRNIRSKFPNDFGHAKALTCDTLYSLNPSLGTLKK